MVSDSFRLQSVLKVMSTPFKVSRSRVLRRQPERRREEGEGRAVQTSAKRSGAESSRSS